MAAFFFPPAFFAAFFFVAMVSHLLPEVVVTTTDVPFSNIEERRDVSRHFLRRQPSRVAARSLKNHACAFTAASDESGVTRVYVPSAFIARDLTLSAR